MVIVLPALVEPTGAPSDLALLPPVNCTAETSGTVLANLRLRPAMQSHLQRPAMCRLLDGGEKKDGTSNKDLKCSFSRNPNAHQSRS